MYKGLNIVDLFCVDWAITSVRQSNIAVKNVFSHQTLVRGLVIN